MVMDLKKSKIDQDIKTTRYMKYILLVIGNVINAYAVTSILLPNDLMSGGITGIARIIQSIVLSVFDFSGVIELNMYNIIYYVLALLVLLMTRLFLGRKEAMKPLFMSIIYPLFLFFLTNISLKHITIWAYEDAI